MSCPPTPFRASYIKGQMKNSCLLDLPNGHRLIKCKTQRIKNGGTKVYWMCKESKCPVKATVQSSPGNDDMDMVVRLVGEHSVVRLVGEHSHDEVREKNMVMIPVREKNMVMIPVDLDDFKKLNEFAEATLIVRNPDRAEEIKNIRRRLLQKHNSIIFC